MGTCDVSLHHQVPNSKVFVMGDRLATSLESQMSRCISSDESAGRAVFSVWLVGLVGSM